MGLLRSRLRRARIKHNDFVFGLSDSGRMDEGLVLRQLDGLPEGVSEMYFHPATRPLAPGGGHPAELAALTSPRVREALHRGGIEAVAFGELEAPRT